ncbi:unnamed protein product [Coffea canephora]|uniref:DH200=94 genomic scaffold, scaffold_515 n=1 Tax=Coffea canephora TaxID=49390 RepID=A0A068VFV9_COFCA|nr:unnamed protein product [Coffea canephora]
MAGLGMTTLANRVCNDALILSHFHILARCTVSQVYNMHSLLVQFLCSISSRSPGEYLEMDENDLAHMLYKLLKRNRYLIFLDDVWEIKAWNLLERALLDDANGSRILFTSRIQLQFKPDTKAHHLRHLTDEESWELLQKKLFEKEGFPPTLGKVGSRIAKFCRGLPLTIVLLSYSHLSDDLKPCLLYFSAYKEDQNVPVRRLLWLWISEGFVRKTEEKSLEDVADDYLKNLIDRSLVMVSEQRTMGGAKACQLHDLVHEFCVKKAKEENFLHVLHGRNDRFILTSPSNPLRVCDQSARNLMIWELMLEFPNTLSLAIDPSSQSFQKILTKLPNIRRLRCSKTASREKCTRDGILVFDYFSQLESLTLRFLYGYGFKFPLNLKKLTLQVTTQPWSEISKIGKLPKLEVLKLLDDSVVGEEWKMKEGLWDFCSWTASFDNFARLEKLVVHSCRNLEELPSCLRECPTLEMIEVKRCRKSVDMV